MNIYVVMAQNARGDVHVFEAFSNEEKALEYEKEMSNLYNDLILNDGWSVAYCERVLDQEELNLTGLKEHQDKRKDPEWCARFNTMKSIQE